MGNQKRQESFSIKKYFWCDIDRVILGVVCIGLIAATCIVYKRVDELSQAKPQMQVPSSISQNPSKEQGTQNRSLTEQEAVAIQSDVNNWPLPEPTTKKEELKTYENQVDQQGEQKETVFQSPRVERERIEQLKKTLETLQQTLATQPAHPKKENINFWIKRVQERLVEIASTADKGKK